MSGLFPAPTGSGWMRTSLRTKFHLFSDSGTGLCNSKRTIRPEALGRRVDGFEIEPGPVGWWQRAICFSCRRLSWMALDDVVVLCD